MRDATSRFVESTLSKSDVHNKWAEAYRTPENDGFFEAAFDDIAAQLAGRGALLDAGCGTGAHALRLARRGFRVTGVDVSENVLSRAEERAANEGLQDRIRFARANLLALHFPNESFDHVLCWGVLMHVPDMEKALAELARVLRPGGCLVLSECNRRSMQARAEGLARTLLRKRGRRSASGTEYWTTTSAGPLMTRVADIAWLTRRLEAMTLRREARWPGQFTELYTRLPAGRARQLAHALNDAWFRYVRRPGPAFGNILIFRKAPRE